MDFNWLMLPFTREWPVILLMLAGCAMIVGATRLATALVFAAFLRVVLSVAIPPMVAAMPVWFLVALAAYFLMLLPFALVTMFKWLVTPALGKKVSGEMAGHLAADTARSVLAVIWTVVAFPFRFIFGATKRAIQLIRQR